FAESPRRIEPEAAREIIRLLPPMVDATGVFMDEDAQVVEEIIRYCGLTMVQLHGAEPPQYCRDISCRVMKSFRIGPQSTAGELAAYEGAVQGFLLDTFDPQQAGGTGLVFDWSLVGKVAPPGPVILAGGLHPGNVGEAIRQVRPYAVDVNSGVESRPGIKDLGKIKEFVEAVRQADDSSTDPAILV
ncbi:MAG: N-(5'-phosphoribosyl)anthranilate isomerase, partial [Deltaproteobacteria bacterium RIFOXYD12_FULL_57_12]